MWDEASRAACPPSCARVALVDGPVPLELEPVSSHSVPRSRRQQGLNVLRWVGVLVAAVLLWLTFRGVDGQAVTRLLSSNGWVVVLAFIPQLFWIGAETAGWQWAFHTLGRRVAFLSLLRVRLSTEAIAMTFPGGNVWCESLTPVLLRRHCGLPLTEGVAGFMARRWLVLMGQGLYVTTIALVGHAYYRQISTALIGAPGLEWAVAVLALVFLMLALGVRFTFRRGAIILRLYHWLGSIPWPRWRRFIARRRAGFHETEARVGDFFGAQKRRLLGPTLPFVLGWAIESLEAWILLRLVGVELGFVAVASCEVVAVCVRHVLFVLPAGLGAQELTYVAFLSAAGVPEPLAASAAFVVLKRSKELFWSAVGYTLLLAGRGQTLASEEQEPALGTQDRAEVSAGE